MFAYDYPILGLFWTILVFFLWIAWLMLLIRVIFDIFRSKDLGGAGKALWALFVIVIPWLGVLVYLIARGRSMTDRDIEAAQAQQDAFQRYVAHAAGSGAPSTAEEITKLAMLRDSGVLSADEFEQQKSKLLA